MITNTTPPSLPATTSQHHTGEQRCDALQDLTGVQGVVQEGAPVDGQEATGDRGEES